MRPATESDVSDVVALSAIVRARHAADDPHFWRPSANADAAQHAWFSYLLTEPDHAVLVDDGGGGALDGFVIGRLIDAPPVYDPGGRTCLVDDLAWRVPDAAPRLLTAIRGWAEERGAVTLLVVTAASDDERRGLLEGAGLHPTSEWWTTPLR